MKAWNAPELEELNISETANGFWNIGYEGIFVLGDRNSATPDDHS